MAASVALRGTKLGLADLQQDLVERLDISFVNFSDEFGISFKHVVQSLNELVLC